MSLGEWYLGGVRVRRALLYLCAQNGRFSQNAPPFFESWKRTRGSDVSCRHAPFCSPTIEECRWSDLLRQNTRDGSCTAVTVTCRDSVCKKPRQRRRSARARVLHGEAFGRGVNVQAGDTKADLAARKHFTGVRILPQPMQTAGRNGGRYTDRMQRQGRTSKFRTPGEKTQARYAVLLWHHGPY
jgi:hypothetical protein